MAVENISDQARERELMLKVTAKVIAALCFGLAVYFGIEGYARAAGGWTFSGVIWISLWAEL